MTSQPHTVNSASKSQIQWAKPTAVGGRPRLIGLRLNWGGIDNGPVQYSIFLNRFSKPCFMGYMTITKGAEPFTLNYTIQTSERAGLSQKQYRHFKRAFPHFSKAAMLEMGRRLVWCNLDWLTHPFNENPQASAYIRAKGI